MEARDAALALDLTSLYKQRARPPQAPAPDAARAEAGAYRRADSLDSSSSGAAPSACLGSRQGDQFGCVRTLRSGMPTRAAQGKAEPALTASSSIAQAQAGGSVACPKRSHVSCKIWHWVGLCELKTGLCTRGAGAQLGCIQLCSACTSRSSTKAERAVLGARSEQPGQRDSVPNAEHAPAEGRRAGGPRARGAPVRGPPARRRRAP